MIAIVDYDIGNINAIANMLLRIGVRCTITSKEDELAKADKIILPGNGSFDACMKNLRESGLIPVLEDRVLKHQVPVLGICVGAQMLGIRSAEGNEDGLGWLDMDIKKFPDIAGLRVPHMGWNQVIVQKTEHQLALRLEADSRFYFVHSYYMAPVDANDILFTANYGLDFAAGVARSNISGVQFHPEKSHRFGKQLLSAFVKGD
ncbi:imidazole glycerol phosphate synthase subunit HisH [Marinobacter sp. BGYM27]|uniref:imidazole glycerol phosphate synthase subunit HisH n=1 Tax=Marinobacter sp. BGYM27 TaxID=2975597 RepID=UPI0021A5FC55|nr:imidazole glycerol phosphate synthase subunit HisH [Marinobacter sp. BGYM27]MDG5499213.1 imidazole glycerol phosphate synthase subunit HisH [Marinobacter sp. BGYM27]